MKKIQNLFLTVYSVRGAIFGGNLTLIGAKPSSRQFFKFGRYRIIIARRHARVNPHRNAVTWTCDQHAWFSFIHIHIDFTLTFCNYKLWSLE
jgi:hypothetical protein